MYATAYKCNACGFVTRAAGTHCNASMVPVIVMENVWPDPVPPTIVVREVVREIVKEVPREKEYIWFPNRYE